MLIRNSIGWCGGGGGGVYGTVSADVLGAMTLGLLILDNIPLPYDSVISAMMITVITLKFKFQIQEQAFDVIIYNFEAILVEAQVSVS